MAAHDVVITGIGLVTSMGVGAEANWNALTNGSAPVFDGESFAPSIVHPLPEIDWSEQIPKRGDQRQMETWQRIGTYCAGLALEDAGIKDNADLTGTMDMIIAAAGGERDSDVDTMILQQAAEREDVDVLLNEILTTELRPTLFLAQLSNLLAGNISIVHKVTGSSRTFMGEEGAGMSAVLTAAARIRSGQSTHMLVGASYNAETVDTLLGYELEGHLAQDGWSPVWGRDTAHGGGVICGSGGAFVVLEQAEYAKARGAKIYAKLDKVAADHGSPDDEATAKRLAALNDQTSISSCDLVVSAPTGGKKRLSQEQAFKNNVMASHPVRGITSMTGHLREAQFPLALAVAALACSKGETIPQLDSLYESPSPKTPPQRVGVMALGLTDAEGMAVVSSVAGDA
ncbi:MAG: beta-ketoacyl-ACP synthase [Pseudomonadota bacterium]